MSKSEVTDHLYLCNHILTACAKSVFCTDAARRFFQTKCEEEALKDKGKYKHKVTQQRRRNRLIRVS